MSPVSRKRKPKKNPKSGRSVRAARPAASRKPVAAPWWPLRIDDVLAGAAGLLNTRRPRELEQATAELIGGALHRALSEESMGFALHAWLDALVGRAVERASPADRYLLHGIAAIASGTPAASARHGMELLRTHGLTGPEWLAWTPSVAPTGDVHVLRDAYGTRFGLVMACGYPDAPSAIADDHVYLLDVDTCSGMVDVVDANVYDDLPGACDAWRAAVGSPAVSATPTPVDLPLLADLLPRTGPADLGVIGGESQRRMDNYYRMLRRGDDLAAALSAAGRPLPAESRWLHEARHGLHIDTYIADFLGWYAARSPVPADGEAVEALAEAWMDGTLEETRLSCSPHRIRALQSRIRIEWQGDPLTEPVAALLPAWTRWCADRTGIDAALAARSVAAAQRDLGDWKRMQDEEEPGAPVLE
jgi:hypothetical protein